MSGYEQTTLSDTRRASSSIYIQFGVPILLAITATLIKLWLTVYIGNRTPFLLYFGVVIVTGKYFGKTSAIIVTIVSALFANVLFLYPNFRLVVNVASVIQTIVFILECALLISLSTALQKAKKVIDKNDARFRALVEKSSEGILTMNVNGKFLYCSPSVQNILGYTDDEFLNLPSWQLLHEDEVLEIKEEFFRFLAHDDKTATFLHRMRHKDGHWIWIESKNTNLLNEVPVNAIITNFSDVTERVLNESMRDDFINVASHELKTPLTSLKAYTQLLQSRFKGSADSTSVVLLNKTEHQINKVIQMVTNLLDVTTLQQKKLNLDIRQFEFNTMVTEVIDGIQQSTKHQIHLDLAPETVILGDKDRLAQVITNLITNAVKYSPNADAVNVSTKNDGGVVALYVQDRGIGIADEHLPKVFERYYRADGAKKTFQGLGLGLFICKQIVEQHEGKIGVMSEEGKGSIFWFSLPITNNLT
jgi:PAS domain S-box-containing protein